MNTIQKEILDAVNFFEMDGSEIKIQFSLPENFSGFDGHFKEKPVLPAICFMEIVKTAIYKAISKHVYISELTSAKFFNVITVSEKVDVQISSDRNLSELNNDEAVIQATFTSSEVNKKAKLKLKVKL